MDPWDGRVVSNFIRQALQNDPITLYGTGKQTRSFCYVSDTVDAIVRMAALKNNPLTPINVGNPNEFTIIELYDLLRKKLGDLRLEMKELPVNDPTVRRPDITLARNVLGWEPRIELSEGLDMTIEHFRRVLK
jgi:UDP-glucuronate decarboxylase